MIFFFIEVEQSVDQYLVLSEEWSQKCWNLQFNIWKVTLRHLLFNPSVRVQQSWDRWWGLAVVRPMVTTSAGLHPASWHQQSRDSHEAEQPPSSSHLQSDTCDDIKARCRSKPNNCPQMVQLVLCQPAQTPSFLQHFRSNWVNCLLYLAGSGQDLPGPALYFHVPWLCSVLCLAWAGFSST